MPDLAPVVGGLVNLVGPVVGPALRAFLKTTIGMVTFGIVVSALCFWWAAEGSTLRGLLAGLLALTVCLVLGFMLSMKRAVATGLLQGIRGFQLGRRLLELVFDRLLGVQAETKMGERGGLITRTAETLPLAQAESRLSEAVRGLIAAAPSGGGLTGWIRRKLQARVLRAIQSMTLAQFREQGSTGSGVDLMRVRDTLVGKIDRMLEAKVLGAMQSVTVLLVGLAMVLSWLGAYAIRRLAVLVFLFLGASPVLAR